MSKVIIIIGLPGSGKTTLLFQLHENHPYYSHQDWSPSELGIDGNILSKFEDDIRYEGLIQQLEDSKDIILDGSNFCNHKFLCQAEYHLNLHFPNIEIQRYYFENNPKDAIANVLYREDLNGSYWTRESGELIFHGHHYWEDGPNKGRRMYDVIIDTLNKLSKNYIIPKKYLPLKIQVQDKKFYEGWGILIRE